MAVSRDGRTLATGSTDKTVILWDLTDRNQPRQLGQPLTGPDYGVYAVAFAPDGRTLAMASQDLRLWDLTDHNQPRQLGPPLPGQTGLVGDVAFAPDGRTLAAGGADVASSDHTVIFWDMPRLDWFPGDEIREACIRAGGPLDRATWAQYAPGVSYDDTCVGH